MAYNPYADIEKVYNAKVGWNKATTEEERKRQNEIATAARKNLEAYGYSDVVNQISASGADATATRKVLEQYAPKETPNTTNVNNPAYNDRVTAASQKNDISFDTIKNDHSNVNTKYNQLYNYANQDVTQTDEYKSAFENIMPSYTLKAMQGRDNELASGAASNGGNIDSYAAANALRQQSALTAKGQALAHQMGLETYNSRISNVNNILSNLGVYNSGVYSAMNDNINNDRNIANDVFNNEQTAFNNEVARLSEQASVTGTVPIKWSYDNNIYLNSDGTVRDEFLTDEFDNTGGFTTIINNAKAKLATTTDPTERANLQATIDAATQAKALKTFSSPKYSQYAHEVQGISPVSTETARQFNEQNATTLKSLGIESDLTKAEIEANERMNTANNQNKIEQIKAQTEGEKDILKTQKELQSGNVTYTLTDDEKDMTKILVEQINDNLRGHKSNPTGIDLIKYNNGQLLLNLPDGHIPHWWSTQILRPIFENNSLSAEASYTIAKKLGFSDDDITSVANAIK